jgi:hypothetical protein
MLRIIIEGDEYYNETTEEFMTFDDVVLDLEHSLISLSKWESKFQKPFLSSERKTTEEIYSYIKAMVLTLYVDEKVFDRISIRHLDEIQRYIDSPQSATTFGIMPERHGPKEVITSELIYYWMIAFNIPFECQNWHLNRLFSLIRICNIKNTPSKKMPRHEIAARNRELNAQRRAALGTAG